MGISAVTVRAFTGGAGCGKTHQLMQSLSDHLEVSPLQDGQKVLALTFMHGSRKRLEERLGRMQVLRGRTDCSTIDSFAWHLVRRWLSLANRLGFSNIEPDQYERVCNAAASLLQIKEVCGWVAATFPILLLDEAQDMTATRLRLVEGLASRLEVFAAADEFQCLNEELRPNPACLWLEQVCTVEELTLPHRTNVAELLSAATAIRNEKPPNSDKLFKIVVTPTAPFAGAWLNGNLHFYGRGNSVAVITPTVERFSIGAVTWAANNKTKAGHGPYSILWEESESKAAEKFLDRLVLEEINDISSVTTQLAAIGEPRQTRDIADWMDKQRRTTGKKNFSKLELAKAVMQSFAQQRRFSKGKDLGWRGMTVHGAKNREFDVVIVLWPAAIGGNDDQKRRLLYNAVTRAKRRCLVLVQAKAQLSQAPFA